MLIDVVEVIEDVSACVSIYLNLSEHALQKTLD